MSNAEPDDPAATEADDPAALRTRLQILREENARLRQEYARARHTQYRRTAAALIGVGIVAVLTALVLPGVRDILLVVAAIGVFGGILTWYLTPERVLTATVSESVYDAHAANGRDIREELGLQDTTVYAPTDDSVRAFVPQHRKYDIPDALDDVFQTGSDATRGVSLTPSGQRLADEFTRARTGPQPDSLVAAVEQLADAVVEQFELADTVTVDADMDSPRVVVTIEDSAFGPLTTFDHPAVSLLACGAADAHDAPITVEHIDDTTIALEPATPGDE